MNPARNRAFGPGGAARLLAVALAVTAVTGCASVLAPDATPATSAPARWTHGGADQAAAPTDLAQWWQRFDDPALTALVQDALDANPSLRSTAAAMRQSRALADVARAGYSPTLSTSGSAQRSRTGSAASVRSASLGLDASWEPDLFGGTRASVTAAEADALTARYTLADAQVSLAAEVVLAYIALQDAQARIDIANSNLAAQEDTLQIARWRQKAGLVSMLDVEQAAASAEQTRATVPLLRTSLDQAQHRLAVLSGRAPGAMAAVARRAVPLPPDDLVMAFPAEVLRQRPDIRAAEARLQAAAARVSQADAARYPSLRLSGTLGLQAGSISNLFDNGALLRTVLASVSVPLFDGGAIDANVRAQQAALEASRADHEGAVLTALQDVEDALVALRDGRARGTSLQAAAAAAQRADELARQQYEAGLIDFRSVLDAQRTLLSAQDSQASARTTMAQDFVGLYKALGGGWQASAPDGASTHASAAVATPSTPAPARAAAR